MEWYFGTGYVKGDGKGMDLKGDGKYDYYFTPRVKRVGRRLTLRLNYMTELEGIVRQKCIGLEIGYIIILAASEITVNIQNTEIKQCMYLTARKFNMCVRTKAIKSSQQLSFTICIE